VKLAKRGSTVYVTTGVESTPLREVSPDTARRFMINVGPFGKAAEFLGYSQHHHILYFLKDSEKKAEVIQHVQEGLMAAFPMHRPGYGGPGTLDLFWSHPRFKPITKRLAAAMQYIVLEDEIVITHMSVRPMYRRQRLNSLLVDFVVERNPSRKVVFDDPTDQGRKFMKGRGFSGLGQPDCAKLHRELAQIKEQLRIARRYEPRDVRDLEDARDQKLREMHEAGCQ
jgi:hypothetical protein